MFDLNDKIVFITGSNGLLGRQMAAVLAERGAKVIGGDITFKDNGPENLSLDITNEASVQEALSTVVNMYGRIDGWVNNAYPRTTDWGAKLEDVSFDSWRKNVDMHLNGYFLCSKIVLEQMKIQGMGSLINMSSIYGSTAPDFSIYEGTSMTMPVAYSAIKGAINNLSKYLAAYYGPYNVRVNTISPGGVFDNQPEAFVQKYISKVPLGRMATPMDIIPALCFLLSDDSSYVTGQNIIIDGGWSA